VARIEAVQQLLQTPWKFLFRHMVVGTMEPIADCALQFPLKLGASDLLQEVHEGQCVKAYSVPGTRKLSWRVKGALLSG
jgi:hypothetical protein